MDVLSEVLKVVKLHGALFYNGEFSSPWCVNASSARALAKQFSPGAEHVIVFHLLTEGRAFIRLETGERESFDCRGPRDGPARRSSRYGQWRPDYGSK